VRLKTVSLHAQLQLKQAVGARAETWCDDWGDRRKNFFLLVPQSSKFGGGTPGFVQIWSRSNVAARNIVNFMKESHFYSTV